MTAVEVYQADQLVNGPHILNDWPQIIHSINYRRSLAGEMVNEMIRVRDRYNGRWVIPLPDVKGEPDSRPAIPALINMAIDNPAQRAASTVPQIFCPALDDSKQTGKGSLRYADIRRRACASDWYFSGLQEILLPKAFRHYRAYGSWCMVVRPDFAEGRARVQTYDPLNVYPDLVVNDVTCPPKDVGLMSFRSRAWLIDQYGANNPQVARALTNTQRDDSDIFEVVEWIDEEDFVVGVIGPRFYQNLATAYPMWPVGGFELKRWKNRAGRVPASIPYRVTLDRVQGAVNLIVPIVNMMARLDLLEYFSAEKAVFPDLVVAGKDGEPRLVGGAWKDGRTGEPNIIENGIASYLNSQPGVQTQQRIDQLERSGRLTSGNPALFGGEATGNIRSGQTVSQLGSYSVDPDLQEMQLLMQRSLAVTNANIMAVEKGYWPTKTFHHFSGWASDTGQVIYTPATHFETFENVVKYPLPGTDISQQTVAISQLTGTGLMSKRTGRQIHPMIEDGVVEEARIDIERVQDALLASLLTQAQQPPDPTNPSAVGMVDFARFVKLVREGTPIEEAVLQVHKAAQAEQATMAPPAQPGQLAAPESMPGIGGGGGAMPAPPPPTFGGPPAISQMPPSLQNLSGFFRALRTTGASAK